jgi:hypothetical protein
MNKEAMEGEGKGAGRVLSVSLALSESIQGCLTAMAAHPEPGVSHWTLGFP